MKQTCALSGQDDLVCWDNAGLGTGKLGEDNMLVRQNVQRTDVMEVSAGYSQICAIDKEGALSCWMDG